MGHVGIVVHDLADATEFFADLGALRTATGDSS